MYLVQVWVLPGFNLNTVLELPGTPRVVIRNVDVEPPDLPELPAILLEMDGTQNEMGKAMEKDFRRLGKVLTRLYFGLLTPFNVLAARLIPKGIEEGQEYKSICFAGPPPGIALFQGAFGFRKEPVIVQSLLEGELTTEVEGAITWFMKGLAEENPINQFICYWIGLEMLAPLYKGYWHCDQCDRDVQECPHPDCHTSTKGPKATQTMRNYLVNELGLDRKEFNELYRLRNTVTHGRLRMDPEGIERLSTPSIRIQQLLIDCIKKALQWPTDIPPNISPDGLIFYGSAAMHLNGTADRPDFYDKPSLYPI